MGRIQDKAGAFRALRAAREMCTRRSLAFAAEVVGRADPSRMFEP